ncbi:MAG: ABC transporter permease [Planctomycetaceae bacterium]|nr:ABC transporter permease [Planctomycetaceae bacterium]
METEFEKSKPSGKGEQPIAVARRTPETSQDVNSDGIKASGQDSANVTTYSAQSSIRNPFQLIQDIFADFWLGRELAWRLFLRNIRGLYRQTLLGLFWAFLPPIANTAIWIFLRQANVFSMGDTQVDGTVYILTGMILWQAFIDAFQMPLAMFNKNRNLISKLNFPRESLLLVGVGEVLFDLLIRLLLLIPAFLIFQVPVHATVFYAPIAILGLVLIGASLGLLLMPIGSLYQDVGRFISMVLPFWMIITPIIYVPLTTFPGSLLNWVNPASPLLLLARDWLLIGTTDHLAIGLIFAAAAIPISLIALVVYRVSIPVLIERMTA